tara:strand:- start:913 stop:1812 length:900 start_codon:yes stop_codon:yes gene_type:complete
MTLSFKPVQPEKIAESRLKVYLFGEPNTGKTWTSLKLPKVLYLDYEQGATRKHYARRLEENGGAWLGRASGLTNLTTLVKWLEELTTEKHDYQSLAIDSITDLYAAEILYQEKKVGNSYNAHVGAAKKVVTRLLEWINRVDMNVFLIAHTKRTTKQDVNGQDVTTFVPDCFEKVEYDIDLCVQTFQQNGRFYGKVYKSRLEEFPIGDVFDLDYDEIAARLEISGAPAKPVRLITKTQLGNLRKKLEAVESNEGEYLDPLLQRAGVDEIDQLTSDQAKKAIGWLEIKEAEKQTEEAVAPF